jgi:hypothetical protein
MLSILIPTYNYNVVPLVLEIKRQADDLGIDYEILVQDDVSNRFIQENSKINSFSNCNISINTQNLGRGKNINLLCSKSKYEYVLIMEADALPESEFYLKTYINLLSKSTSVIFGGVKYPTVIPPKEKKLRWKYGINRESKSLDYRLKNNYDFVFTWNLLLKKDILSRNPFPEFINEYGYEDLIFIKNLRLNSIPISHIENPLIHHNDDYSLDFIKKSEKAIQTLHILLNTKKIDYKDTRLSSTYLNLKNLYLIGFAKVLYLITKKYILNNLASENPNLYLFDIYKLGCFCTINLSKNV